MVHTSGAMFEAMTMLPSPPKSSERTELSDPPGIQFPPAAKVSGFDIAPRV